MTFGRLSRFTEYTHEFISRPNPIGQSAKRRTDATGEKRALCMIRREFAKYKHASISLDYFVI